MAAKEKPPRQVAPLLHDDGVHRCPWAGADPLYIAYHDEEWGVPEWESRALFEKLILDGSPPPPSCITILPNPAPFPAALDRFAPATPPPHPPPNLPNLIHA